MADIRLIGAVGVKVRPDTSGFRQDTKRGVEKELRTYDPEVNVRGKVKVDTDQAERQLRDLEQKARNMRFNPGLDVDTRQYKQLAENIEKMTRSFKDLKRQRDEFRNEGDPFGAWAKNMGHFNKSVEHQKKLMRQMAQAMKGINQEVNESGFGEVQRMIDRMEASQDRVQNLAKNRLTEVEHLERRIARLQRNRVTATLDLSTDPTNINRLQNQIGMLRNRARILREEERQLNRLRAQWDRLDAAQRSAVQGALQAEENASLALAEDDFRKWRNRLQEMTAAELKRLQLTQEGERELAAVREELDRRLAQNRLNQSEAFRAWDIRAINARAERERLVHERANDYERDAHKLRLRRVGELNEAQGELLKQQARYDKMFGAIESKNLEMALLDKMLGDKRGVRANRDLMTWTSKLEIDEESLKEAKRKAERLRDEIEQMKAEFDVEPRGLMLAAAQLKYASRDRMVNFYVRINEKSLIIAEGLLKSLAALNVTRTIGQQLESLATNFDQVAVKASALSTVIGSLAALGGSAFAWVSAAAGDLLKVGGLLVTLPAAVAAATSALFINRMAWQDFGNAAKGDNEALAELPKNAREAALAFRGLYTAIQKPVQRRFWEGMQDGMKNIAEVVLPVVSRGLQESALHAGRFGKGVTDAFRKIALNGDMRKMFRNLSGFFDESASAAEPLFDAINRIGLRGSEYLPQFGRWLTDISRGFDQWARKADAAGKFNVWIEDAVKQTKLLGSSIASATRIIYGLGQIGHAAGAGGLQSMADSLRSIADIVNGEPFSSRMASILTGAMEGTRALGRGFRDLGADIGVAHEWMSDLLEVAGQIGGGLLTNLGRMISNVKFQTGTLEGFEAMRDLVRDLEPSFVNLGTVIGNTMTIAAGALRGLAPVINTVTESLAGITDRLADSLAEVAPLLTRQLAGALTIAGGIIEGAASVVGTLVDMFNALPGPIQRVILAFGAFTLMRGQIGGAIERMMSIAPLQRFRDEMIRTQVVAGRTGDQISRMSFGAMAMDTARQKAVLLRGQLSTLGGAFAVARGAAGGLMSALGGPWGLALGAIAVGVGLITQNWMDSQAAVEDYFQAMKVGTAEAMTNTLMSQMSKDLADFETRGGNAAAVLDDLANNGWRAVNHELVEFLDVQRRINNGFSATDEEMARANAGVEQYGLSIKAMGDGSQESTFMADRLRRAIQSQSGEIDQASNKLKIYSETQAGAAEETGKLFEIVRDAPQGFQDYAAAVDAFDEAADDAEASARALGVMLDELSGQSARTSEEFEKKATRGIESVHDKLKQLATDHPNFDWNKIIDANGVIDTSTAVGADLHDIYTQMEDSIDDSLAGIQRAYKDKAITEEEALAQSAAAVKRQRDAYSEALKEAGVAGEAHDRLMQRWDARVDPKHLKVVMDSVGVEKMDADLERLARLGLELTQDEYQVKLNANGDSAITEGERVQGMLKLLNNETSVSEFKGDAGSTEEAFNLAMELGVAYSGETFVAALDADGQPTAATMAMAMELGRAWTGSEFVATASMTDEQAVAVLNHAMESGRVWDGEKFTASLNADDTPTADVLAQAFALGQSWDGKKFVAFADATKETAEAAFAQIVERGEYWDGRIYRSILASDGTPAADVLATAHALGQVWNGKKFVAIIDGNEETALAAERRARGAALKYATGDYEAKITAEDKTGTDVSRAKRSVESVPNVHRRILAQVFGIPDVNSLKRAIAGVKNKTVTIGAQLGGSFASITNSLGRFGARVAADGSISGPQGQVMPYSQLGPRIQKFADGGLRSAYIAGASQSTTVWNEGETFGEAFIPLAASKRSRSLQIWRETGKRLGVNPAPAPRGGDQYAIYVTKSGATGSEVADAIQFRQRRNGRI